MEIIIALAFELEQTSGIPDTVRTGKGSAKFVTVFRLDA